MQFELIALVGGALAVIGGLGGALWRHRQLTSRVSVALSSGDSRDRLRVLSEVARDGVAAHAEVLVEHLEIEHDDEVLDEISRLVRAHQWEPIENDHQRQLRRWAITRPSEHDVTQTAPNLATEPALSELEATLGERVDRVKITTDEREIEVVRTNDPGRSGSSGKTAHIDEDDHP